MPSSDIYLDLDQLKDEIISLNDKKLKEIDKMMRSACNTVATLTSVGWSGMAKDAFMQNFTDYKKDMKLFYDYVAAFNKQLKTIHANGKKLISTSNKIANKL